MKVFRSSQDVGELARNGTALAIGNFDGVHIGHRALFALVVDLARRVHVPTVALTFDPHPARFFGSDLAPPLITSEQQKLALLEREGIDAVVIEQFDRSYANIGAEQFVRSVLVDRLAAVHVVTGKGFVFGRQRNGTWETLVALGREHGFVAHGMDLVRARGGIPVSSTKVREFVLMGRMRGARALLGREFAVAGEVVTGEGRGRTIGLPTANLLPETELVPGRGVYAGRVLLPDGRTFLSVINVGTAPTVRRSTRMIIEAHLLDFPAADLVGRRIEILFNQRLREEERFASVDDLIAAIHRDIARARDILGKREDESDDQPSISAADQPHEAERTSPSSEQAADR